MDITWYGMSCFRLIERGKAAVVIDPYDHNVVGLPELKLRADIVTVSHEAPGHNYTDGLTGKRHLITGPGEYEIGGVFITGVPTTKGNQKANGNRNILYTYDFDGVTVAHLGDLSRVLTQSEVEALGGVDVALVPVGGGSSLNAAKAAEVISLLEPGIVIPMHYHTPGVKIELSPIDRFLREMGLGDVEPIPVFKIGSSSIPEETRVVVLEPTK